MVTSSQNSMQQHLEFLSSQLGPRPVGSQANKQAAVYIQQYFKQLGLDVEEYSFECPDWRDNGTILRIGDNFLNAHTNSFSTPCDLTGYAQTACTLKELECAEIGGKICVLYGELTKESLTPKNCPLYQVDYHQEIIALLEEKQPSAIITITPQLYHTNRVLVDWDFKIPSAMVLPHEGLELFKRIKEQLHIKIDTKSSPSSTSTLIARKPGISPDKIVIMAHYDTTFETPGALDNGGGMALVLELANRLTGLPLDTALEFIAFSEHEYGGFSDPYYVQKSGDSFGKIIAAINFDAAGYLLGTNTMMLEAGSSEFRQDLDRIINGFPGVHWIAPWPQSNHSTFSWRGIPAVAFTSPAGWGLTHLPLDTFQWVSLAKLGEVLLITEEIVKSLQDKSLEYTREKPAG